MNVTVVGAGIVGCAIAHELASRGAAVRVLDPRGTGRGATHASAGILAPGIEGHSAPFGRLAHCGLAAYDAFVARVRADSQLPFEYERCGSLQVALDASESAKLSDVTRRLSTCDAAHAELDAMSALALEPRLSERAVKALLIPGDGYVAVGPLMAALADAGARRGVAFLTTSVSAVHDDGNGVHVVTPEGRIDSDAVVVAAGSWSSGLSSAVASLAPVKPIRGQLLRLRARGRAASHVIWGTRCYIVPWVDGTTLVGATVEDVGFDETSTAGAVRELLAAAFELIPALQQAVFEEVRVGLRPMTPDELPVIGVSSTMRRVLYATGHYRNGVLLGPLTASLIADLLVDGRARAELALTRPDRVGL